MLGLARTVLGICLWSAVDERYQDVLSLGLWMFMEV